MDSDEEDVSENDIVDWYKSEVEDIWDTATDSAFADLSSNFTEMFRQVMNDVKQRSQSSQVPNGHTLEVNGHSSAMNGVCEQQPASETTTNTVSVSTDQLLAMLQDEDDEWLEESSTPSQDEEPMVLSVQLTDPQNQTVEDQKNVKGVSQESNPLADSIISQFGTAFKTIMPASHLSFCFFVLLIALYAASLSHKLLQMWFLKNVQDYIYLATRLLLAHPFLANPRDEMAPISDLFYGYEQKSVDCQSCSQLIDVKKRNPKAVKSQIEYYSRGIPVINDASRNVKLIHSKMDPKLLLIIGGFFSNRFSNLGDHLRHRELHPYSEIDGICSIRFFQRFLDQIPQLLPEVLNLLFMWDTLICEGQLHNFLLEVYYNWQLWNPIPAAINRLGGEISTTDVSSFY